MGADEEAPMDAIDVLSLLVPVTYFLFLVTERLWPAREFPQRTGWQWIGISFLILSSFIGTAVPLLIPGDWLDTHRLLDGTRLGVVGGVMVGFVVVEGAIYAWHRSAHNVGFLWRGFHQIHHSPMRVDVPGSMLFHPLEMIALTLIQLFVTVIVLGVEPLAAAIVGYAVAFCGIFQHWNVHTPRWLGYVIQRPESHCVHHRMGLHYYNYSDLPLWDIIFGTFRNPPQYLGKCGFEQGADTRLGAMLRFADVNAPLYGPGNLGQRPSPQ
jgi:sterol desaturase/sphingolipid hydroxylase (fatty acid hydroxylase superfamily)